MYIIELNASINQIKEYATFDEQGIELTALVMKTQEEIDAEKQIFIDEKTQEIQAKVDEYEAKKQEQLLNGGPGPVADVQIMKICNEHNCEFEIKIKD